MSLSPQSGSRRSGSDRIGGVVLVRNKKLSVMDVLAVARGEGEGFAQVVLEGDWELRCRASHDYLRGILEKTVGKDESSLEAVAGAGVGGGADRESANRALIYGVTTGFGNNKNKPLKSLEDARRMQVNLLRSHAVGVGDPLPVEVVRAMILLRIRSFMEGHSAVRPELVRFLVEMLNRRIHPWIPAQGSVGASGDLCPMAHLALVLLGEGMILEEEDPAGDASAEFQPPGLIHRRCKPAIESLQEAGLAPLETLEPKEGLALTNGTGLSTALAVIGVWDARQLLSHANLAAAMSLQALKGCTRAFDSKVHEVRLQPCQAQVAKQVMALAAGSPLLDDSGEVQDAYSLRCVPQVHGACMDAIEHAGEVVEREANAVTDNPLFLLPEHFDDLPRPPHDGYRGCAWEAYSAGNFHAEQMGMTCDHLKVAVAELASISERRIQYLLDPHHNRGLPANLAPHLPPEQQALHSGLMIAQYTAASLVSENKVLAHPATVDSIPTSANAEDHVSMAPIAGRQLHEMLRNARYVLGIEIMTALRALALRRIEAGNGNAGAAAQTAGSAASLAGTASKPVAAVVEVLAREEEGVRRLLDPRQGDDLLAPTIWRLERIIQEGRLLRAI